jgi:hypothetical protein
MRIMRRPNPFDQKAAFEPPYNPHYQCYAYDQNAPFEPPFNPHYQHYAHPHYYYYNTTMYPQMNRKRQRRQAAAIVVESLWNNGTNSSSNSVNNNNESGGSSRPASGQRRSTAQPRPVLTVPPKGIGPIADPNVNDVLCGRGGRINSHPGNVQFRDVIHRKKKEYLAPTTKKLQKAHIAAGIVQDIRTMDPPGRFLKEEKGSGMWYDIGDAKAIKKTGQALREDAPDIRPAIEPDGGSSGDEMKSTKASENKGAAKTADKSKRRSSNPSPRNTQSSGVNTIDDRQQNLIPILPQQGYGNNTAQQQRSTPDYNGQSSMPPPFISQGNNNNAYSSQQVPQQVSQQQQFMQLQGFETRNIPIQVPLQPNQTSFPNQMYSGGQSTSSKHGKSSRKAMEALSEVGLTMQQQQQQYPSYGGQSDRHLGDLGFGLSFQNERMIGDDNTISTISGLSEPISSLTTKSARSSGRMSGYGLTDSNNRTSSGYSDLMNMSLKSNMSFTDSMRLRSSLRGSLMPAASGASIRSGNMDIAMGLNGSIKSGFAGSLTRSNSFPDNMSGSFMEYSEEHLLEDAFERSMAGPGLRNPSAMSIGSMLDVQSNASSSQWYQAAVGNLPAPDEKSFMSSAVMSADLDALDLASTF